ncbi:uncharacterized protein PV07_06259 [Cladophialophora immunda]|uniref:Uncharacterized protein n=1 Tax=Cladophialophora immunda TaxID=569365 RepID=A0A0D2CKG0_9EURO|nr:uncharacterized protein PV07_06259 [Cladophialophora immunda]KIW30520.1 hypothetical protein PV07_06259 [Cladophialophora immunda]
MHLKVFAPILTGVAFVCFPVVSLSAGIGLQPELSLSLLQAHQIPRHPIQLRTPPTFNEESSKPWDPLPPNWFLGNWFITYSNQELYHIFRNFIWTLTRPCADDACYSLEAAHLADLASFQLVNDTQKPNATYFGYSLDTAIADGGDGAYHSVPTGSLAPQNNTYEVISWGYDSEGVGFVVVYETPAASETAASLDIFSRAPSGPTNDTLDAIQTGIQKLGNKKLIDLLKDVTRTPQDGGRKNDPWPSCNATCRTNDYHLYLRRSGQQTEKLVGALFQLLASPDANETIQFIIRTNIRVLRELQGVCHDQCKAVKTRALNVIHMDGKYNGEKNKARVQKFVEEFCGAAEEQKSWVHILGFEIGVSEIALKRLGIANEAAALVEKQKAQNISEEEIENLEALFIEFQSWRGVLIRWVLQLNKMTGNCDFLRRHRNELWDIVDRDLEG